MFDEKDFNLCSTPSGITASGTVQGGEGNKVA